MAFFVLHRRKIVKPRVTAMGIVPGFDKLEDSHSAFRLCLEPASVEEFALQGGEEAFTQNVVEAVSDRSGGRPHLGLLAPLPEGDRSILTSLVGMMNHSGGATLPQSHIQCVQLEETPSRRHIVDTLKCQRRG